MHDEEVRSTLHGNPKQVDSKFNPTPETHVHPQQAYLFTCNLEKQLQLPRGKIPTPNKYTQNEQPCVVLPVSPPEAEGRAH